MARGSERYKASRRQELERAQQYLQRMREAHPNITDASCDALLGGSANDEDVIANYNDSVGMVL